MAEMADQLLIDADTVANLYAVEVKTIRNWLTMKRIPAPAIRQNRYVRWRKSDIVNHIEEMIRAERVEAET